MRYQHDKLNEAAFFIELLEATENRSDTLTKGHSLEAEASYLLSAVLNAFYSAIDPWGRIKANQVKSKEFQNLYPEIYSHSHHGGWRSTTVHVKHLQVEHHKPEEPSGNLLLLFGPKPKLSQQSVNPDGTLNLKISPRFSLKYRGKWYYAAQFAKQHLAHLAHIIEPEHPNATSSAKREDA